MRRKKTPLSTKVLFKIQQKYENTRTLIIPKFIVALEISRKTIKKNKQNISRAFAFYLLQNYGNTIYIVIFPFINRDLICNKLILVFLQTVKYSQQFVVFFLSNFGNIQKKIKNIARKPIDIKIIVRRIQFDKINYILMLNGHLWIKPNFIQFDQFIFHKIHVSFSCNLSLMAIDRSIDLVN